MVQEVVSPNGHTVLYGENAKDNEILTFQRSHKNDIWFHARDVPGSHVILRPVGGIKPKHVDKVDLQFTANIAAVHSKARKNSGIVPISYCLIGNVSRPSTPSPMGMVEISDSKTIMGLKN